MKIIVFFCAGDSVMQLFGASHSARGEVKGPAHVRRKIQELFDKYQVQKEL